jgi:hypothetical protein
MGRHWIQFDPANYTYCSEPGFHLPLSGSDFLAPLVPDSKQAPLYARLFHNPPGSDWLLPWPRQFNPEWFKDDRLSDHVTPLADWTFATGVVAREFEPTRRGDGTTYPDNRWIHVAKIPDPVTSLDATNYTTLWAAATEGRGGTAPALATIGTCADSPVGLAFSDAAGKATPMLQWSSLPEPAGVLVFGWSHFAWVLQGNRVTVLRDPLGDKQTWQRLASFTVAEVRSRWENPLAADWQGGLFAAPHPTLELHMLKALLVGFHHLYLYPNQSAPFPLRIVPGHENVADEDLPFPPGGWWLGAAPGAHFWFQSQVMGYEEADTDSVSSPAAPLIHFDLGETYLPTLEPETWAGALIWTAAPSDLVQDFLDNEHIWSSAETGNEIHFGVRDEADAPWVSDGTHQKGGIRLKLVPGTLGALAGAYQAPQVQVIDLRFPPKREFRQGPGPQLFDDQLFMRVFAEVSLREADGKRVEIDLNVAGAQAYKDAGLDRRSNFPVHWLEDVDNNGVPETVRCRAWVVDGRLEELSVRDDLGDEKQRRYRVHARGLLTRLRQPPVYLPQLVNPAATPAGTIEHTWAVEETLLQAGMDPAAESWIEVTADPLTGTAWARLPGTWGRVSNLTVSPDRSSWAPKWDETRLAWLERLAKEFAAWLLYENLTEIRYHPDLQVDLQNLAFYYLAATLYRNKANAVAAGVPGQYYEKGGGEDREEPRGNLIRVTGKDSADRLVPHYIARYPEAWTAPSNENFTGEPVVYSWVLGEEVEEEDLAKLARVFLERHYRRWFYPWKKVLKAPWEIQVAAGATCELGAVMVFEGEPDQYLLVHLEVELLLSKAGAGNSKLRTRFVGEKLPQGANPGELPGLYPGHGLPEEE